MAITAPAATLAAAARAAVVVAELQHQIEATVVAGCAVAAMVPRPMPVTPVAVGALSVVLPDTGGRAAAEVPAVSDLLVVLLLHLRDARTSRSGSARQGRAAERGHGKSQRANGN